MGCEVSVVRAARVCPPDASHSTFHVLHAIERLRERHWYPTVLESRRRRRDALKVLAIFRGRAVHGPHSITLLAPFGETGGLLPETVARQSKARVTLRPVSRDS